MNLTGRLTRDATVHNVKDDRQVVNFSVAINDRFKTKAGEWRKVTTYVDCAYWLSSKVAEWLKKGSIVELTGRLGADAYINQQGEAVGKVRFHANEIRFWHISKEDEPSTTEVAQQQTESKGKGDKDDLPF